MVAKAVSDWYKIPIGVFWCLLPRYDTCDDKWSFSSSGSEKQPWFCSNMLMVVNGTNVGHFSWAGRTPFRIITRNGTLSSDILQFVETFVARHMKLVIFFWLIGRLLFLSDRLEHELCRSWKGRRGWMHCNRFIFANLTHVKLGWQFHCLWTSSTILQLLLQLLFWIMAFAKVL